MQKFEIYVKKINSSVTGTTSFKKKELQKGPNKLTTTASSFICINVGNSDIPTAQTCGWTVPVRPMADWSK